MIRSLLLVLLIACGRTEPAVSLKNAAADTLLDHLPPDTEAVVAGSLTDLAAWPLWRRVVQVVTYEAPGIADRVASRCNLDPWTVFDAAALAFTAEPESSVFVAQTTFDRARLHECATKVGDNALAIEDGAITKYRQPDTTELATWIGERIVLAVPNRMDELEALEPLIAKRAVPARLQALLARVDRGALLWGVALTGGNSTAAELVSTMPLRSKPIGVHGAIRRVDGLHVRVGFVFVDAAGATEAVKLVKSLLAAPPPPLVPWRDSIRVEAVGDEARVSFDLDVERARTFGESVIALLPAPSVRPSPEPPPAAPSP